MNAQVSRPSHQPAWSYLGLYQGGGGVSLGWYGMASPLSAVQKLYRIEWASLIIEYDATDISAEFDLGIDRGTGFTWPLLSVAAATIVGGGGTVHRNQVQTSNPFTLDGNFGLFLRGSASIGGGSHCFASVAISQSWPPAP